MAEVYKLVQKNDDGTMTSIMAKSLGLLQVEYQIGKINLF